jgi:hypothetical protein
MFRSLAQKGLQLGFGWLVPGKSCRTCGFCADFTFSDRCCVNQGLAKLCAPDCVRTFFDKRTFALDCEHGNRETTFGDEALLAQIVDEYRAAEKAYDEASATVRRYNAANPRPDPVDFHSDQAPVYLNTKGSFAFRILYVAKQQTLARRNALLNQRASDMYGLARSSTRWKNDSAISSFSKRSRFLLYTVHDQQPGEGPLGTKGIIVISY